MTAIGSVAPISAPKTSAEFERPPEPHGEPARDDERAEHNANGRQRDHRNEVALEIAPAQKFSAASNRSGGSTTSKIRS